MVSSIILLVYPTTDPLIVLLPMCVTLGMHSVALVIGHVMTVGCGVELLQLVKVSLFSMHQLYLIACLTVINKFINVFPNSNPLL